MATPTPAPRRTIADLDVPTAVLEARLAEQRHQADPDDAAYHHCAPGWVEPAEDGGAS
ncbi:hypothetical protein [Streptomyces youssoufiensis]